LTLETLEEEHDRLARLKKAIGQLPERQQEALNLKFNTGLSYPDVALLMDISVESARTLVYRSVKTLRQIFEVKDKGKSVILMILRWMK